MINNIFENFLIFGGLLLIIFLIFWLINPQNYIYADFENYKIADYPTSLDSNFKQFKNQEQLFIKEGYQLVDNCFVTHIDYSKGIIYCKKKGDKNE